MKCLRFATIGAFAVMLVGSVSLTGCKQQESGTHAATQSAASNEVVWPELRALDSLVHTIDALTAANRMDDARARVPELIEKATLVAEGPLPTGAHNVADAQLRQAELQSLVVSLSEAKDGSDEDLKPLLEAFHPVVIVLGQRAGIPHKHDDHSGHDHDHDDHDHSGHNH